MKSRMLGGLKRCSCCGTRILFQGYNENHRLSKLMEKQTICFDCAYWQEMKDYPPLNSFVVNNQILKILPEVIYKDNTMMLGGRGKRRYFIKTDGELLKSNDVWLIANIPPKYQKSFRPTAFELTGDLYRKLKRNPLRCKSKGCYDRYRCARYKRIIEQDSGPFNQVPKSWRIGNERCRYFVDLINPKTDETQLKP